MINAALAGSSAIDCPRVGKRNYAGANTADFAASLTTYKTSLAGPTRALGAGAYDAYRRHGKGCSSVLDSAGNSAAESLASSVVSNRSVCP